jgi:integrase
MTRRAARAFVAWPRHPLTGRQFRVSARTDRELAAYVHQIDGLREQLRLGMIGAVDVDRALRRVVHGAVTLERAARAYMERPNLSSNTRRRVRSFLASAGAELAPLELDAVDAARCQQWIDRRLARRHATSTIGTAWRTLRAVARYAAARGWIGAAPWGAWRPVLRGGARPLREALRTVDELARLLGAAAALDEAGAPGFGEVEAKIAAVALLGLRRGELAGLRWSDLAWASFMVTIARQYIDGAIKGRTVCTLHAPALFPFLARHRDRLIADDLFLPDGPIFPQRRSSAPGRARAYTQGECLTILALRSAVRAAGLPNPSRWSTHSLRDSFVTLESQSKEHAGDLASLADRSRHASLASLSRYLRTRSREPAPPGFSLPDLIPAARAALAAPQPKKHRPGKGGLAGR